MLERLLLIRPVPLTCFTSICKRYVRTAAPAPPPTSAGSESKTAVDATGKVFTFQHGPAPDIVPVEDLGPFEIRLQNIGCKNRRFDRIVVQRMKHSPNANEIIENLGSYDSMPNDKNEILIALNLKRLRYWIGTEGVVINPWVQKLLGRCGFFPVDPADYVDAYRARKLAENRLRYPEKDDEEPQDEQQAKITLGMPLVNYEGDSSDEENDEVSSNTAPIRLRLPPPAKVQPRITAEDKDEIPVAKTNPTSSSLLANLPKPQDNTAIQRDQNRVAFLESDLEDIVRGENKQYAQHLPTQPKPVKRKRDGPVKIFLPTIDQDVDDEEKPKRKQVTSTRNCALLNALPAPIYDEDQPIAPAVVVKPPSSNTPQISSTGLFLPYTLKKKPTKANASGEQQQLESDEDDDDDDDQTDFLGLTKSNQVQVTNTDVESVLRETYPKARPIVIEAPPMPMPEEEFEDLDQEEPTGHQMTTSIDDDDELSRFLPKSERYKEIKHVHIDSMLGETARLQLLKNVSEEREAMLAQAAINVPKGETRKRAQITYLIAKAQSDDLRLKNMWSEQKLTKRQTQAKYGF